MSSPVLFQALPPLSPEEYSELERSILDNGVMVPIVIDENNVVIDGHHRQRIARHHNLPCPSETKAGFTDTEKRSLALSLNLHRRHLTREQKRALVAESIKADPQLSDREHGRRTGTSQGLASRERAKLEESDSIDHFSARIDPRTGNASQPATKTPRATSTTRHDDGTVETAVDDRQFTDMTDDEHDNAYLDEDAEFWEHHPNNEPELAPEPEPVAPQPEPEPAPKPRRRPLEAGFFDAVERLRKATISLQNLGNDDRLPRNKENVRRYRGDVLRAIDALQCVAEQLN